MIFDRAAITHNKTSDIRKVVNLIKENLKDEGKFIGIDWFSVKHSGYACGNDVEDKYTKLSVKDGMFAGLGNTHFANEEHLRDLFQDFKFEVLEEKVNTITLPEETIHAAWNFVVSKKTESD